VIDRATHRPVLIDDAIAVVVAAVTALGGVGIDATKGIIAIEGDEGAVLTLRSAKTLGITDTKGVAVDVNIVVGATLCALLVDGAVAVVVTTVARLAHRLVADAAFHAIVTAGDARAGSEFVGDFTHDGREGLVFGAIAVVVDAVAKVRRGCGRVAIRKAALFTLTPPSTTPGVRTRVAGRAEARGDIR